MPEIEAVLIFIFGKFSANGAIASWESSTNALNKS